MPPKGSPQAPLSSVLSTPPALSADATNQLIDDLRDLIASRGWQWIIEVANREHGSKAVRARLTAAQHSTTDLAVLGALTQSTLASALAIERLLHEPNEMLLRLKMQRAKQKAKL